MLVHNERFFSVKGAVKRAVGIRLAFPVLFLNFKTSCAHCSNHSLLGASWVSTAKLPWVWETKSAGGGSSRTCPGLRTGLEALSWDLHLINKVCCRWHKPLSWSSLGVRVVKIIRNRERKTVQSPQRDSPPLGSCDNWQSSYTSSWIQLLILPLTSIL